MSLIDTFFPSLSSNYEKIDARNFSATKKGPGRKHKQGATKGEAKASTFTRSAGKRVKIQQQTDNVTNTPLKAATRGG